MALAGLGSIIAMCITAITIIYYNSKNFFKEFKESLSIKQKEVLGERAIQKFQNKK